MGNTQKQDFEFFMKNLKEISKKYKGKFIGIKDEKILGAYTTFEEAINELQKLGYDVGSFIIQEVKDDNPSSYILYYHNYVSIN